MRRSTLLSALFIIVACFFYQHSYSQPTWTLDPFGKEKKPEQYEEKKLGSEKTAEKKFTGFRHFVQNNVTHYNFYFNANNKLNAVIERAKESQQDDYGQLLAFYPYSLETTSAQATELDSVIYKSTAGILLHDLRNDWVDNLYFLIGKAYYLRNDLDSAALTFQFINYNLFPRTKKEDDSRIVGTNDAPAAGLSIANKEKRNVVQKAFTVPPSRNDALIWLARTFIEKDEFGDAAGLINILQNDRNLPSRLKNDLEEVTAYWFYKQHNYDSSATHLARALSNADTKQDQSRWEFLLAQMYERTGNFKDASSFYAKAAKHTTDPVMDIYARLNDATMLRNSGNYKELQASIDNLLKMAKKDKFESYRDVIYYSAGLLTLQKPDTTIGISQLLNSTKYNKGNILYRNRAYLKLADLAYNQGNYKEAYKYYDSLNLTEAEIEKDAAMLTERKQTLAGVVERLDAIDREDSLQRVALMPDADRDALIKKLVRKYRREMGLKEEEPFAGNTLITFNNDRSKPVDLFAPSSKGEWYFYNSNLRSRGFTDFRAKWGKRENIDNWRRKTAQEAVVNKTTTPVGAIVTNPDEANIRINGLAEKASADYSYDGLLANLPLTREKVDSSNGIIAENLLDLARIFQNELFDYPEAILAYQGYLQRFPSSKDLAEVYLGLYYSYTKLGDVSRANYYKNILSTKYSGTTYSTMVNNPALLDQGKKNPQVTARYAGIYDMFIEGKFAEAAKAKQAADSAYGANYWSPQLLYIESVYYIRERKDSQAIAILKSLQTLYPESPLKAKAATMVDVLGRRSSIEQYLSSLEVTRAVEDTVVVAPDKPITVVKQVAPQPTEVKAPVTPTVKAPSMARDSIKAPDVFVSSGYELQPEKAHFVVMILDKVDGVYINEAKNAFTRFNRENYLYQNVVINRDALDPQRTLLLFSPFTDATAALAYFEKVKKAAPLQVSWLPPAKYSFMIISQHNLDVLKSSKDIQAYKQLLNTNYGNKF